MQETFAEVALESYKLFFMVCELNTVCKKYSLIIRWIMMFLFQEAVANSNVFFLSRSILVPNLPWGSRQDLKDRISK